MKDKFIKSTLILMIGGVFTKLFSLIIRIYFTRVVGQDGLNIYSIIMPTFSLLVALCQLGFPVAIANVVAKGEKRGHNVMASIIPVAIIINLFLIFLTIISARFLANHLLHEPDAYYPIIALSLVLPFISLSSIIRGYFFGKQQMLPHSISNILEQLFKLFIVIIILPKVLVYGPVVTVTVYVLINIISELISIIIFLLFLPKGFKMKTTDLKPDLGTVKEVLSISIPSVGGRLIGNIGYFLEPIVLTAVMLFVGYSSEYIVTQYAIYSTFVIGVLVVPSFFITAISTALLPEISKQSSNKRRAHHILHRAMFFSFLLGLLANIFFFFFGDIFLDVIFRTNEGFAYLRVLAIFFSLYYLEAPMASALQALGFAKYAMRTTLFGIIIKLLATVLLSLFRIGIYSLIFAEIIFILVIVILNYTKLHLVLKKRT